LNLTELLGLSVSLSLDLFFAFFTYGVAGITVRRKSAVITPVVCAAAFWVAAALVGFLPTLPFAAEISGAILIVIGVLRVYNGYLRKIFLRSRFAFLRILGKPETADFRPKDNVLSGREAVFLSIAMSLDGIAGGAATGMVADCGEISVAAAMLLLVSAALLLLGYIFGKGAGRAVRYDVSPLGGIVLVVIGVLKIVPGIAV
jgi:putative Mn2+ efflux pump MntP